MFICTGSGPVYWLRPVLSTEGLQTCSVIQRSLLGACPHTNRATGDLWQGAHLPGNRGIPPTAINETRSPSSLHIYICNAIPESASVRCSWPCSYPDEKFSSATPDCCDTRTSIHGWVSPVIVNRPAPYHTRPRKRSTNSRASPCTIDRADINVSRKLG